MAKIQTVKKTKNEDVDVTRYESIDLKFDYSEFDDDVRDAIVGDVINLKFEYRKTTEQLIALGRAFLSLQKKTAGRFEAVCNAEFPDISYRSILRYIKATNYIEDSSLTNKMSYSASAIYQLMNLDDEVIGAIREKIESKDSVSGADIKKLLDEVTKKNIDLEKELVESKISFADQSQQLKDQLDKNDKLELAARQLKDSLESAQKRENRAKDEAEAISNDLIATQDKIKELEQAIIKKSQETEVAVQEVQILPPEYKSLEEALKDQNKKLQDKQSALAEAQDRLAQVKAEITSLESDKQHIKDQSAKLTEFMHSVQKVFEQYPASVMTLMFNANGIHIDSLKSISSTMKQFASNVDAAVAEIELKEV